MKTFVLACVALVAAAASAEANNGFGRVNNNRRVVVVRQPVVVNRHANFSGFNYGAAFAAPCQVQTFGAAPCSAGAGYGNAVNFGGGCFGNAGFNNFSNFGYGASFGSPVVLRNRFLGNRVVNPFFGGFGFGRGFGLRIGF